MPRRIIRATAALAVVSSLVACSQDAGPADPDATLLSSTAIPSSDNWRPSPRRPQIVPGELLVKFDSRATQPSIARALGKIATRSVHAYSSVPGLQHVTLAPGVEVQEAKAAFEQQFLVEYAEPNFIYSIDAVPDDPLFPRLWALQNTGQTGGSSTARPDIGAVAAWDITTGDSNVVISVIDTGVDYDHEDLAANMYRNTVECTPDGIDSDANGYIDDCYGIDTASDDADPTDENSHGTHVAGTIGAVGNNGIGVTGVAWNVRILPCRFLNAEGFGNR